MGVLERTAAGKLLENDLMVLPLMSLKSLAPKLDVHTLEKLLTVGGRAIATASVAHNAWLGLKFEKLHEATNLNVLKREVDDHRWVIPGSSLLEKLVQQDPSGLLHLGGSASALLESILSMRGGRIVLTAGDSCDSFASYLVKEESEKASTLLDAYESAKFHWSNLW